MKDYPIFSFVIPTLNSSRTLEMTLESIRVQTYPQNKIEVLIIDGGSSDNTLVIAQQFKCKVVNNPKVEILEAEQIGYQVAKGKYMVGLAPDEVLENENSLNIKYKAFAKNSNVKVVLPTGYKTPDDYAQINNYVNEFGDPFSYFMYRDSKGYQYLSKDLEKSYKVIFDDKDCKVFSFCNSKKLPLIETWAGGSAVDLEYIKNNFSDVENNPSLIPLFFYLLISKDKYLAVTKDDPTVHYSSGNTRKYMKKIRSRIEWNVFKTPMGMGGFSGRVKYERRSSKFKKYLFIPYSFTLIIPFYHSIYLATTRRKIIFLLHLPLCIYTSCLIIYYYLIKLLGIPHKIKLYGH